jgi:hypothetical protein
LIIARLRSFRPLALMALPGHMSTALDQAAADVVQPQELALLIQSAEWVHEDSLSSARVHAPNDPVIGRGAIY